MQSCPVWDLHTHLYPPSFGTPLAGGGPAADPTGLMLWGIDELLTYHYLIAEVFRAVPASELPYRDFWRMTKREQADHVWRHLFLERSPVSESCRGVLTTLARLGLDPGDRDLAGYRKWFESQDPCRHLDRVMELAGVTRITMTNAVFDDNERARWLADPRVGCDPRFAAVLRFDPLVCDWPAASEKLSAWGYPANVVPDASSLESVRRFLRDWIDLTKSIYCAVSLPPTFRYQGGDDQVAGSVVLREAVLPVLAERGLALAMMIGVQRGTNPDLRDGGDTVGIADNDSLARLCRDFPQNRFLCTMLARENQLGMIVIARKFGNLLPFGCWWFLNIPSLIAELTSLRTELLGTTFVPQHSDARVLEQILYKWKHSREVVGAALAEQYTRLAATGWRCSPAELQRDVRALLHDNFARFVGQA